MFKLSIVKEVSFTVAKPSKDITNMPPHVKPMFIVPFCIMNNNNFCICNGAAYHSPL